MNDTKKGVIGGVWLAIVAFHVGWYVHGTEIDGVSMMLTLGVVLPAIYGVQSWYRTRIATP